MKSKEFMLLLNKQLDELLEKFRDDLKTKERAFIAWCLINITEISITETEAVDAIVDGGQEKGIDAIYIPDKEGEIIVLQTKYHVEPRAKGVKKNDLVKIFAGVEWLFDGNLTKITNNNKFKAKAEEFRDSYINFDYSKVRIIYAGIVNNGPSKEEKDEIERYEKKLVERGAPFTIETYTIDELNNILISNIHRKFDIDIDLKFVGDPYSYEKKETNSRAIVGTVKGSELVEIFEKNGFRIFDINIRNFLGNVKINQGITNTATNKSDSHNFWYYNNGVTIVCDRYSFRSLKDTVVRLENAQIINGCQTINSLAHAGNKLSDDVELLIKVIEKKSDINFVKQVTLYANSQNAVRGSDLVGTDTIQLELKRQLQDLSVYYETRRGDYRAEKENLSKPIDLIISLKEAAQALAAVLKQLPGLAKKDTSKLFQTKNDGGIYDDLFDMKLLPEQIILSVSIMRVIPKIRKKYENIESNIPIWLPHSDTFLSSLFYLNQFNETKINDKKYLNSFTKWLNELNGDELFNIYKSIVTNVDTIVKKYETQYGFSYPTFFKTQNEYNTKLKPIIVKQSKKFHP
jgi:hypothetical protein